jgi:hypothetical protein
MQMVCAACGSPLRPGAQFCNACGAVAVGVAPRRAIPWRTVALGTALAAFVVAGIVAARSLRPPGSVATPSPPVLVPSSFADLGFAVGYPRGWRYGRRTVEEGRSGVLYRDPASGAASNATRAFDVIPEAVSLTNARADVEATFRQRYADYAKLAIEDGATVDGRAAFRHRFATGGLVFDQWWIERGNGTFRVTFWSPRDDEQAGARNANILTTFRIL